MSDPDVQRDIVIAYDETIKQDSPVPEASPTLDSLGEGAISEIQSYLRKYSTTSSVFAEQSLSNPDYQRTLYCISCILQAELFDDLKDAPRGAHLNPELVITTTLPPHLGGPVDRVPEEILDRECRDDPELRVEIEAGTVPTVDTILRFISWLHQSAKYSAQCNIIAFIYVKRMMDAKCILTMSNWRGMWLGSVVLAQKVWDDASLRTSSFASILPGVSKSQLKALELKIFTLLNYCTSVKPSVYARFYFELREIFKNITGEFRDATVLPDQAPRRRPLTIKKGKVLRQCVDDVGVPVSRSSKAATPRSKTASMSACTTSAASSAAPASAAQPSCPGSGGLKLPAIAVKESPLTGSSGRVLEEGAGGQQPPGQVQAQAPGQGQGQRKQQSSGLCTPGGSARQKVKAGPKTLEDYEYINSTSIFVLS